MKFSFNFGIGVERGAGSMQETGAAVGDQIGNPGENSAWHATTNLGFRFLVDFWHVSAVHETQSEFWHWSNRGDSSRQGSGAVAGDQTSTPRGNSARHATTHL